MRKAIILAAALTATTAVAQQQSEEYLDYLAELETSTEEWVVISFHFRHGVDCTSSGCVIIGPTRDEDACKEWARLYNSADPDDHSRCVSANGYDILEY